ncbi:MAG: MFS transporter [Chloroflexi bacterium]|nr:MFS transporter [Chloroflexota bacterium]MBU1751599.1 MFS transporter [Chloroflexota bacterium]MBU1879613.1 MFS transporter [Chloroflexota bacterium]
MKRVLRWLLRLDQPAASRTAVEIATEVERNYRWNLTVNVLDGTCFWFGASFISSATIVPLFISKLTPDPLALGLAAVIAQGTWYLPQLFTANGVERLARMKPVVVNLGFFTERLPIFVLVLAALVAGTAPFLALALFLIGLAWHGLGAGVVATAWQDLIARCFPVDRRGRFMGTTMFAGIGMGALGAILSTWLLGTLPFPANFAVLFSIAAGAITLSWVFLALTREPVQPATAPRQSNRQFWTGLPAILRQDANFRRFLVARLLLAGGAMGVGFVTVAAVHRWAVPDSTVGLYTAALLGGQTAGNLAFGFLADRYGHKLSLEIGGLSTALAFAIAWLAPAPEWYFAVFALLGVSAGAAIVSGILVVLEFGDPTRRPTYVGLVNTGLGLVNAVAPLVGAGLAGLSYEWLFALCAGVNLVGLAAMRWWVREPRWSVAAVECP